MKKIILAVLLCLGLSMSARAQSGGAIAVTTGMRTSVSATGSGLSTATTNYHQITWSISGTIATCTITVDTAPDDSTWSVGGAIPSQNCAGGSGQSAIFNVVANWVRLNVTVTGGGTVQTNYFGYSAGGSGGGSPAGSLALSCGTGKILSLYEPYLQNTTSATSLTDYGPSGNTAPFASAGAAPSWISNGSGILFGGVQYIAPPFAAFNGAKTVMVWGALTSPQAQDAASTIGQLMIGNNAGQYLMTFGAWPGVIGNGSGGGIHVLPALRTFGNFGVAATLPTSGGTASTYQLFVNGYSAPGYFHQDNSGGTWNDATGAAWIGSDDGSFGASWIYYGSLACNNVLTAAQIATNDYNFKANITVNTGVQFVTPTIPNLLIFNGDSRWANAGLGNQALGALPYLYTQTAGLPDPYYYTGYPGNTMAQNNTNIASYIYSIADGFEGGSRVFLQNAGYNDISSGTSAATILTSLQSWCSSIHTRYPASIAAISTIIPGSGLNSTQEGVRETLNASILSGWRAATLGCDSVIDEAADPTASTQVVPNGFNPSGSSTFNSTYFIDGVHYQNALAFLLQSRGGAALLAAKGNLQKPYWMNITIPAVDVAAAGLTNTSVTMPLVNLGPNWRVCGVTANVTVAYTGLTTPHYEVGDSATALTSYIASTALDSPGSGTSFVGTGNPTKSIVEVTFIAANALSNAATGSITFNVCVTTAP